MWCKIKFQLKSNLEPNWIWTFPFLYLIIHLVQKLKIRWDMWHKIENPIYIYIYIYINQIVIHTYVRKHSNSGDAKVILTK